MFLNYFYDGCSFVGLHLEASYQSKPKRPRKNSGLFLRISRLILPTQTSEEDSAIALGKRFRRLALLRDRFGYSRGQVPRVTRCRLAEKSQALLKNYGRRRSWTFSNLVLASLFTVMILLYDQKRWQGDVESNHAYVFWRHAHKSAMTSP